MAVIGRGFGLQVVAPAYRSTEGFDVVDVVSPRDERAVDALIARDDVDLVSVHSPPFLHLEHVRRAVAAGRAVLCDKPFGMDAREAETMHDLARDAGVLNLLNFEFRCHPPREKLRELIQSGVIGQVEQLRFYTCLAVWRSPPRPFAWSFDAGRGGGWVRVAGSHTVDFARWTFGEIAEASGLLRTTISERPDAEGKLQPCSAETGYTAMLRTESGVCVTIDATATAAVQRPNRITAIGDAGVLELVNENPREVDACITLHTPAGSSERFRMEPGDDTYAGGMQRWVEKIRDTLRRGRAEPGTPTFADGLACSRVMDRILGRG